VGIVAACGLAVAVAARAGEPDADSRTVLRRAIGDLEARAAQTRVQVRERARDRGAALEGLRRELLDERVPELERQLARVREAVENLRDDEPAMAAGGIELVVESCWPKWHRWLAADKYLFRAVVRVDEGTSLRSLSVREPSDGDLDLVRIPAARARDDGRAGEQFEIFDSFKIWGVDAELVAEDTTGREHAVAFDCDLR